MLTISKTHSNAIAAHSVACFPDECCGALFGKIENTIKIVTELKTITNHSDEDKRRRFKISDDDYKQLEAYATAHNVQLLGFYHSHPNHPAQPSETDLKYAWPFFSYLIQSVYDAVPKELNSFELNPDTMQFSPEHIRVV